MGQFGHVEDIAVQGEGRSGPAVAAEGGGPSLTRVTMVDGSVGYDARYVSGAVLTECQVHENGTGLKDLVDSMVAFCTINANGDDGISLGPGANDNTFVGNKVEWNDGHGISALQAVHNLVSGGILDRNGLAGVRLQECGHTALSGLVLRRNGRLAEGDPTEDVHVHQLDCEAVVVTGIVTHDGADDDASGYRSPSVALRHDGGVDIAYTCNDLTGRTSAVAVDVVAAGTRLTSMLNLGVPALQEVSGTAGRGVRQDVAVPAGSTGTASLQLGAVADGTLGDVLVLRAVAQVGVTRDRSVGESTIVVSRQGELDVALGPVVDVMGGAFGAAGPLELSAVLGQDGGALQVLLQNRGAVDARVGVELR
ncbi:right-handed parallel beta-helix repeat-containing protein [Klenkia sp. PcliD-1-E]|uniref:right-handed parallel beta-helix repeat-containing protein n=1 Tax=Klenkia sp. PcliD-1-E TaxID=2954492 RepID=UPI002096B328|nr:right-handed parallel beta-helix repeat-containing protein [Klenkia sp. PcliD-1-E]MCO7221263.1 right-handed parallel beta-helix repeat-containing protein [Klenkia sp. PcliD-1-E]